MSESTSRGPSHTLLDPSNPSISKQTMLDWLRIHHPMTPIKSNANKGEVAKIVREQQPEYFEDPTSDAPAVIPGPLDHYPAIEDLSVSSSVTVESFKKSEQLGKRSASQELERSYPHKRVGLEVEVDPIAPVRGGSKNSKNRKSLSRPKASNTGSSKPRKASSKPSQPPTPSWVHTMSVASPNVMSSISSAICNNDEKNDLEALKGIAFAPLINSKSSSQDPTSPNSISPSIASVHQEQKKLANLSINTDTTRACLILGQSESPQKPVMDKKKCIDASDDVDLIQFSDTELLDTGNPVIGRDIPAINIQDSPSTKKTGVDIFQEEQQQEEKVLIKLPSLVRTLEERLARVESALEVMEKKSNTNMFQNLQKEQAKAGEIALLSSKLEQAMKEITILKSKVRDIDVDVIDQQADLDGAHTKINAHARVLRQLLGPGNDDLEPHYSYDSSDEQDPPNVFSCNNDSLSD
ncbi:uncharacterized protein MELLADRAFT_84099 [Melampsora larici-populina 98AG31]|uniref:Uncharacterized protein n=1 Tax=Melampsora larici-populina (strain 98AG31 / pathotype 3-4-7) TaxID=747676 RepID=F4SBH7_MELLP|nr:uncharacterized protein MELLADRAFT_84099 [Melampsora larici-populina 98AG31]EGF98001.1 hypothetical protein MELLADRAFT_84099 [Melampsora larici-populina 98AG31]